ncbi:formate dehydrogenase subunit alpha [Phosphitispora sp. TUW77]|uniref:formate dehydrogenase subunit alpha n=1 Tax=Phosphitispora sp. TUW77 TaxID=3152361 RepID=UPI003AB3526B
MRVCAEIVGRNVVDFISRGFNTNVSPALQLGLGDKEAGCINCGSCVAVCPVGALTEKSMMGIARAYEVTKVKTTCSYCGCGCNFDLNVKDGKIVGVSSNLTSEVNGRHLCVNGRFGYDFIHSSDRLVQPLIKKDGDFVEVSWEEAISYVASRLKEIKETNGSEATGVLTSARCTNEENYLMNKLARVALGTNNIDHSARLEHSAAVAGLATAFGSGAMTNSIGEIKECDYLFVIGSTTHETHHIVSLEMRKAVKNGAKLVVAHPEKTEITEFADVHVSLMPGGNIPLLNAMCNVIIAEGLYDKEFVANRTEGFDELKSAVENFTPEAYAGIIGIPAETIREIARGFATAKSAAIFYTDGITQHTSGADNVLAVANLAMLTGQIGKSGSGVYPLRGQNNVQGACDMGALPDVFPGYQSVAVSENVDKFTKLWGVPQSDKVGFTAAEMMDAAQNGDLKALYILGENSKLSAPDINYVKQALENLEFLVVQDIFLTETAKLADVVLPGASFAEKDGTFSNTERRVQRVRKAIEPLAGKADWQIISEVLTAMGYTHEYGSSSEIFDESARVIPQYAGISYDRLEETGIQWPCPNSEHPGTVYLHEGKFARGQGKFTGLDYEPPAEALLKS